MTTTTTADGRDLVAYAADIIIWRQTPADGIEVLLIRRGKTPYVGALALAGGHVDADETASEAAIREAAEETSVAVDAQALQWVGLYDTPGRDPRRRVISAAYAIEVDHTTRAVAGDDAATADWVDIATALQSPMAFDHGRILADAYRMLRSIRIPA